MMPTSQSTTVKRASGAPIVARCAMGFVAGALAVLVVTTNLIEILYAAGIVPGPGWNLAPVPPFDVPQSLSFGFWGGMWGVVYALLEPRLTRHLGWWLGGVIFGVVLPLLFGQLLVPALKAMPIRPGLAPSMLALMAFLHALFGFATAAFLRLGLLYFGRNAA